MTQTKDQQVQEYAEKKVEECVHVGNFSQSARRRIQKFDSYDIEQAFEDGYTACEQSMWRSLEEELPPGTLVILCQSRMGEDNAIALCVYIKNRFMIYDGTFKYDKDFHPTHWMPIPKLPSLPDTNTEKK